MGSESFHVDVMGGIALLYLTLLFNFLRVAKAHTTDYKTSGNQHLGWAAHSINAYVLSLTSKLRAIHGISAPHN